MVVKVLTINRLFQIIPKSSPNFDMINDTVFNALPRPQLECDLTEEGVGYHDNIRG